MNLIGDDFSDVVGELLGTTTTPQVTNYVDKPTVLAVQTALKAKGFDPGTIDGVFGAKTAKAIKLFQAAVSLAATGVIDYELLTTLRVPVPAPSTRTEAGSSASAAAQDVAAVANNAAAEANKAGTGATLLEAAKTVEAASTAAPPAPPEVQAAAKKASAQAAAAKTPAEVEAAKVSVKSAAAAVGQAAVPGWWVQPAWAGAGVKRWHMVTGAGVAVVLSSVLLAVLRRKK